MKFIVSSTALFSHLQAISRVINSKNALPILDCFLFELEDGTLSVTVSDSETTMVTSIEVNESDMNGRFAVTAKTLLDALKEIPEQPLTFDVNTGTYEITVQYQNGKYNLVGQNADEFPQSAVLGDNAVRVEMDAQILLGGINRSVFATADDELRPVMNGIYFDITTEDITMVASDGHKLVRCKRWLPVEMSVPPLSCLKNRLRCSRICCRRKAGWLLSNSTNAMPCLRLKTTVWYAVLSKAVIRTTTR